MSISIIVPVYNASKSLERTIKSVLSQDFSDFELVLIDDGSFDNSIQICKKYSNIDERVRVFGKTNGGVSSARNFGLDVAKGEWICFIDSDDEMLPGALQVYFNAMEENVDVIRAGFERIKNGEVTNIVTNRLVTNDKAECICLCNNSRYEAYLWNSCFRKSAIGKIRFNENLSYCEDHLFTFSVMRQARQIAFLSQKVYRYYASSTSLIFNNGNLSSRYIEPYMIIDGALLEYRVKKSCVGDVKDANRVIQEEFEWKVRHAIMYAILDNRYREAWKISKYLPYGYKVCMSFVFHMKLSSFVHRFFRYW